jgi:hypothetical protein
MMDQMATLEFAIGELHREVAALEDSQLDIVTNCEPWMVSRLASHALNNQLLWAGLVPQSIPTLTALVDATCTDDVRTLGLIKDVAPIGPDASDTDRLMAQAGRARPTIPPPI